MLEATDYYLKKNKCGKVARGVKDEQRKKLRDRFYESEFSELKP